jgi:hypothetical protein
VRGWEEAGVMHRHCAAAGAAPARAHSCWRQPVADNPGEAAAAAAGGQQEAHSRIDVGTCAPGLAVGAIRYVCDPLAAEGARCPDDAVFRPRH